VYALTPSNHLTENELEAARLAVVDRLNVQTQRKIVWPASAAVAYALLDQLARDDADHAGQLRAEIDRAVALEGDDRSVALTRIAGGIAGQAGAGDDVARRLELLAENLRGMAGG
jgi:hypothetical protein